MKLINVFILTSLLLVLLCTCGTAENNSDIAKDITKDCIISSNHNEDKINLLTDSNLATHWKPDSSSSTITISAKSDIISTLYIQYHKVPQQQYNIYYSLDGEKFENKLTTGGNNQFLSEVIYLPYRVKYVKLDIGEIGKGLCEVSAYSSGKLPDTLPKWQPQPTQATLMVIPTHPDDEILWFGGTLPTYGGQRKLNVITMYMMNQSKRLRQTEAMNGLWMCGLNQHPVFLNYRDMRDKVMTDDLEKEILGKIIEQIRLYKPQVILTHDLKGEYGHTAHVRTAKLVRQAFSLAAQEDQYPESANQYGTWQVKKLYMHLFKENKIDMQWDEPLSNLGNKTGFEIAKDAFQCHVSQLNTGFKVQREEGKYPCTQFGLAETTVGLDIKKNDFLENISPNDIIVRQESIEYGAHYPHSIKDKDKIESSLAKSNNNSIDSKTVEYTLIQAQAKPQAQIQYDNKMLTIIIVLIVLSLAVGIFLAFVILNIKNNMDNMIKKIDKIENKETQMLANKENKENEELDDIDASKSSKD